MTEATLIVDAKHKVDAAVAECNRIGRDLVAETGAFTRKNCEQVLAADCDRVLGLAMDLLDARSRLSTAVAEFDALKRRR